MRRNIPIWPPLIIAVCLISLFVYCQALEQHISDRDKIYHREQQILEQLEEISRLRKKKEDLENVIRELERILEAGSEATDYIPGDGKPVGDERRDP